MWRYYNYMYYSGWLLWLAWAVAGASSSQSPPPPNIIFLVCESTDGRTWRHGYQDNVIPLPNLRRLEAQPGSVSFHRHYSNSPVCCPSRASLWSGRHAHKIPHEQRQQRTCPTTGETKTRYLPVEGVWNNFEGLDINFTDRIDQVLQRSKNYTIHLSGKRDWTTGGHSENVQLSAWTMYARFPYNISKNGGWIVEEPFICADNGTVLGPEASPHWDDWKTLHETVAWMKDYHQAQQNGTINPNKPFFVYQGMNIVHPPYVTNQYWYDKIDPNKILVPDWVPLDQLHPCDLQSSMMKGCIPPMDNATAYANYHDYYRRRNIRRIYYAMIAEFDAMVGAYMDAVQNEMGREVWENTIFIVTSDHGDLQMEHQQSYKMVPYEASSSVPLIVMDGRVKGDATAADNDKTRVVQVPTQLIDLYPTIMDLAGVSVKDYPYDKLDGYSLVPLLNGNPDHFENKDNSSTSSPLLSVNTTRRPDFVVSQFHGMNIAMSWFLIVKVMPCVGAANIHCNNDDRTDCCTYKLVIWGTGNEVDSQLFDLTHDPDEMNNLIHDTNYQSTIQDLKHNLLSVVDYPSVALNVAAYNKASMKHWIEVVGDPAWRDEIHKHNLRWYPSWEHDSDGAFQAFDEWINSTKIEILPCRSDLAWPPKSALASDKDTLLVS